MANKGTWLAAAAVAALVAAMPADAAQPSGEGASAAATAAVLSVPALQYRERTLANGARVFTILDRNATTASVNVWYDVGQRDDPVGRGGFAHLFEHLMFKPTRNLPQGVQAFIISLGGQTNASTHFDFTNYYATAPANRLESLVWLEGERLRNLVVDQTNFASERDVVKEELRQRVLAQPYGRILYTLLPAFTFSTHPYARPIGGSLADLDAAVLADVQAFHEAYYRPDNAIYVINGNFDPARVDAWVDQYLGSIPRPSRPIPRDARTERARTAPATIDAFAPNVPLPAIVLSWQAPAAEDPDGHGLALIETLLTRGSGARLRRRLVDEQQLASSVTAFNIPARDGHVFALQINLAQGREVAEAEAAFNAELARLRDTPVGESELNAAKNLMLGDALSRRETARGQAFDLGEGVALDTGADFWDRRLAAIRTLTAADVQRIARTRLDPQRQVTIRYQDESRRPAGYAGDTPPDISEMGTIVPPATQPPVQVAADGERQAPPAAGEALSRPTLAITDRRLGNGLRVVSARPSDVPLTTMKLVIGGGDSADPAGKAGLADVLAASALRGAGGRDAAGISEAIAALGGSIAASADPDATTLTVTVPAANAEAAGRILADVAMRPAFAEADVERVRRQQSDALSVAARQPTQAGLRVLSTVLFEGSPYGAVPTAASLASIGRDDLMAAHGRSWGPANATLVVTGGLGASQATDLAERLFGGWNSRAEPARVPTVASLRAPQLVVVDLPSAGQTSVLAAVRATGRGDSAWPALQIANARLGGGPVGFLSQEIRARRGLSYGAGSLVDPRRGAASVMAVTQTRNDAAAQVVDLMLEQFGRVTREPIAPDALAERSDFVTNILASQTERTAGLGDYLASLVAAGVPLSMAQGELQCELEVNATTVDSVAERYLRPENAVVVVAGDSRQWIDALRTRFPGLRVVSTDGVAAD